MFIIHNIIDINPQNIYFSEGIKNTVLTNGKFIRIMYSTSLYILNTILINIKLQNICIEHTYNKYKCSFPVEKNMPYIKK